MLLWSGQIVSALGSTMSGVVMPLLILALTDSPAAAGVAGMLVTLPYLIVSLPAGALVDRWDRKHVMILCDLVRAAAFASIPVALALNGLTIWQIYAVALVEGTFFVFFNIAEVAALPRVVSKDQLAAASAQNMAAFNAAALAGPALGGFLYQVVGRAVPFVFDTVSFLVSALSLMAIRGRFQEIQAPAVRNLRAEIREGIAWAWNEPLVRLTSFLSGGLNFAMTGSVLVVIVLAQNLGADEAAIGTMFSMGAVGGVLGSAVAGRVHRRFSVGQIITATTWIVALLFPFYAVAPHFLVLGLINAVLITMFPVYSVAVLSYRLALIPDALQGRVNSAVRLVTFGFQPLGSALAGLLLQYAGPLVAVAVFSAWLLGLGVLLLLNPTVREAGQPGQPA
jgi:MFS family permease